MVGIVIVSHSQKVAEGVVELCRPMAPTVPMAAAGGLHDGGIGTDFQRIYEAVEAVQGEDGVAILFDMGSAIMTTEMVLEAFEGVTIKMADAPLVEGAIAAAVNSAIGMDLDMVLAGAKDAYGMNKL
jgi:dihydroxyacetone kinase phosphotransfer subunit